MSKYVKYYSERQDTCRTLATMYTNWVEAVNPTKEELAGVVKFFNHVGKRFGLISEFRKLGII